MPRLVTSLWTSALIDPRHYGCSAHPWRSFLHILPRQVASPVGTDCLSYFIGQGLERSVDVFMFEYFQTAGTAFIGDFIPCASNPRSSWHNGGELANHLHRPRSYTEWMIFSLVSPEIWVSIGRTTTTCVRIGPVFLCVADQGNGVAHTSRR